MAALDAFYEDLREFDVLGRIGASPLALETDTLTPEIGTTAFVTCRCGRRVQAHGTLDGVPFVVNNGEVLPIRLQEDHPYSVRLTEGQRSREIILRPQVSIPRLDRLVLPRRATYLSPFLQCRLLTSNAAEVTLEYQAQFAGGESDWQRLPVQGDGSFTLPVAVQAPHRLALRISLASRHARFSPRALLQYESTLDVHHPAPVCDIEPLPPVYRYDHARELALHFAYYRYIVLTYNDECFELDPVTPDLRLPLDTSAIGEQHLSIDIEDYNGEVQRVSHVITILPREHAVEVQAEADGSEPIITLAGAVAATLSIPARYFQQDFPLTGGRIRHAFQSPVVAFLDTVDDSGNLHRHAISLTPRRPVFHPLPTMTRFIQRKQF
ncbi:hypothetical protein AGMMS50256_17370 [Betaproteobacteria bacterium]|nr:hypothetical protein AGMMS50256_17370 [Betaproteobacteria bacterium]